MTFSWLSLLLLVLCCIQYGKCQIISSASMEAATKTLSEQFARLQQYGLGVNTMMDEYQRLNYEFSTLDETSIQALLSATMPQELVNNVSAVINDITDENTFNSPTDAPPNCCSVSNSDTYCCYGCSGNTEDNKLFNFARNKFASSLQWAEFYVGLANGGLLQFPPSRPTNCTNMDARFMPWYTRATVDSRQREVVILLDLNGLSGSPVDQLSQTALNVINSLNGNTDKVGLVMVTDNNQRSCPDSLVSATINEIEQLSKLITEKLVTRNRDYSRAFANARAFFTNSNSEKLFLFLTDGRRSVYNGVFGNVTEGWSASIQVYTVNDASSNSFLNSLVNAEISPLSDIGNYWSSFLPNNATGGNIVYSTDVNSQGVQCLSMSRKWVINGELMGVVNALLPWSKVLESIVSAVDVRPSSYFLVTKKEGDLLYHSQFPYTIVVDVDPTNFEKTTEFSQIKDNIAMTGQNESRPFNNTLLTSGFNQSYFIRKLPSEYHCNRVLNVLNGAGSGEIFVCLILANEDISVIDSFENINVQSIYRTDPTRLPIYQTKIADQPSDELCSNYICQYSTEEKLALQLTDAPSNPAALIGIDNYIAGNSGSKPAWVPDGTAERIAVHTLVGTVWRDRAQQYQNESAFIIRRHLATPTGIYLSFPGVQLVSSFNPQRMPWYLASFVHGGHLTLSPARQDPLGLSVIYSASYGLKGQQERSFGPGSVLSILSADLTEESLRIDVINSLMQCNLPDYDCTVLTSDGYFVLRPQDSNTAPLHLTEANKDYIAITRTLLQNGILTKRGCNDIANFTINNNRFYSFSDQTNGFCFTFTQSGSGCSDFCIQQISNTNNYLLVTKRKSSSCVNNAFGLCTYESNGEKTCGPCTVFSNSSVECPCSCTQTTCATSTMNSFPVCPRRTDMSSNYIPSNPPLQMATDIGFCSSDFCNTTLQSTCQSIEACTWCLAQGICVPLGTCCSRDTSCCTTSAITSLPSCLQHRCTNIPTATPTTSEKPDNTTAAIVGGVIGSLFAIILLLLFVACCVWYQFFRTPDSEELKTKSDFNFADVKPSSTNRTALELQEKPPISPNGETV